MTLRSRSRRPGSQTAAAIADPTTAATFEKARSALLTSAEGGNLRAIDLLARGALDSLSPADTDPAEAIEPHVAEAAIAAANLAHEIGPAATAEWLRRSIPPLPVSPGRETERQPAAADSRQASTAPACPPTAPKGG